MRISIEEKIKNYIQSESRNKIIIFKEDFPSIPFLDIGYSLAKQIKEIASPSRFSLIAKEKLEQLLNASICQHQEYGKFLAITNPGILFEKDLKLDFLSLIDKYSKQTTLFLKWEGDIQTDTLYFLTINNGIKFSLAHLSHIII